MISVDSNLIGLMELVVKVLKTALYVNPLAVEPFEEKLYQECGPELSKTIDEEYFRNNNLQRIWFKVARMR